MPFLPFIPFADTADVVFAFIQQGVPWNLTFNFKYSTTVTLAALVGLFTALDGWWSSDLSAFVSSNCDLDHIKLTDLSSQSGPVYQNAPLTVPSGTLSGNVLPAQTAIVTTRNTALRGRSYRGRSYLAGRVFTDQQTVTHWTSAVAAAIQASYENGNAAALLAGWTEVIASRQLNSVRRTTGVSQPITGYVTKTKIGTIKNRLG